MASRCVHGLSMRDRRAIAARGRHPSCVSPIHAAGRAFPGTRARWLPLFSRVHFGGRGKAPARPGRDLEWETIRMHGVEARRKVVHFGLSYGYDRREVSPTAPASGEIAALSARAAAELLGIAPAE